MTVTLYDVPPSGHCHRVRLAAGLMGVDLTFVPVMEMEGQRTGAEYLAINPLGQVPAIKDGDFVLNDSIAIIRYLAAKYAPDAGWLTNDPQKQARIDEWLAIAAGSVFRGPNSARLVKLFGAELDYDLAVAQSEKLFRVMNDHLEGRDWLVGDHATLADIANYSYLAVAHEGDLDLSPYPNINAWMARMRKLDGFVEMVLQP